MTARAQVTATVVVLLLIGAIDFITRVHVPRSMPARDTQLDMALSADETLSLAEARQRLQSWLPDQADAATDNGGTSGQGAGTDTAALPDRAELAGRLFVLRGIFATESGEPFAVLEVQPQDSTSTERHDLVAGDTVDGVRVEQVAGRRVSLSDGNTVIHLSLFLDPGFESVIADEPNE